jgi:exosome complex exonuclease RRP6
MFFSYPNPYRHELMNLKYRPDQMESKPEIIYLPLKIESCIWVRHKFLEKKNLILDFQVDSPGALEELIQTLKTEREIAIDLEHHQFRTYQGITCLIQISTRRQGLSQTPKKTCSFQSLTSFL